MSWEVGAEESEPIAMRYSIPLLVVLLAALAGCDKTADEALAQKFRVSLPQGAVIKNFAWSGAGMNHWYIWLIEPADQAFIDVLLKSADLRPGAALRTGSSGYPAWWDQEAIGEIPEVYVNDVDNMHWTLWVDRSKGRLYLYWWDT